MKMIIAKALGLSFTIVGVLTFFEYRTASTTLIHLLYPGAMLSLLITGGHGGTLLEEKAGLAAGVLVNTLFYAVLCGGLLAARDRVSSR
jgi:hypothetical protein